MPASGRPWVRTVAALKAECEAAAEPCWLCRMPIDYKLSGRHPRAFTADHVTPTSMGGDALRRANLKPAHYPRLQQRAREHRTRSVPELKGLVTGRDRVGGSPDIRSARDLRGGRASLPTVNPTSGSRPTSGAPGLGGLTTRH